LQILAGKRLVIAEGADVRIKGKDVFRESPPGVTFLGTEWFVDIVSVALQDLNRYQGNESCGS
jgi:CCR4-NOT complex subunit CAF16